MKHDKLLFIDLSYYVIHRYFAVLRWFKFQGIEQADQTQDATFTRFDKSFEADVKNLCKRHEVELDQVIFVKDTPRDTIWRMSLFREYKGGRASLSNFDPEIFVHVEGRLLSRVGCRMIECARAEADDIIAVARRTLDVDMVIITNDHDYIQLLPNGVNTDHTTIVNANNEPLTKKYTEEMLQVFLEYKVCKGDTSDNIPSIGKKIGEKTALKLACDPVALAARKTADPAVAAQYELNKTLMSFDCIPADIVNAIVAVLDGL